MKIEQIVKKKIYCIIPTNARKLRKVDRNLCHNLTLIESIQIHPQLDPQNRLVCTQNPTRTRPPCVINIQFVFVVEINFLNQK